MRTFKLTIAKKVQKLQYSTYYCYTRHKILVLVVLIIEAYGEIPLAQNCSSIETSIHLSFFVNLRMSP